MQKIALLLLVVALVGPAAAQDAPTALYMTDESATTNGATDARLLSPDTPTGDPATLQFSPVSGQPADTYDWVTGATQTDDLELTGAVEVELHFEAGLDAASTTTVTLIALAADGTERTLGSDDDGTPAQAPAHQESFSIDTDGAVINEGEAILLRISVTGGAAIVQLQYGGSGAESGITALPTILLDTDGDGVGDSAERRAGTDPDDASDTPGSSGSGNEGTGTGNEGTGNEGTGSGNEGTGSGTDNSEGSGTDGTSDNGGNALWEPILAAFFLLICLALAGFALLGRFTL